MSDPPAHAAGESAATPPSPHRHHEAARELLREALDLSLRRDSEAHVEILYLPLGESFWRFSADHAQVHPRTDAGRILTTYSCGGKLLRGARDLHDALLSLSWVRGSYDGFGAGTVALRAHIPEGHPVFLCARSAAAPLSALIARGTAPVRLEPVSDRPQTTPDALPPMPFGAPSLRWRDPLTAVPVLYTTPHESALLRTTSELWVVLSPAFGGYQLAEIHVGAPVVAVDTSHHRLGMISTPEDALCDGFSHALVVECSSAHPGRILAEQRHRELLRERSNAAMADVSEGDRVLYRCCDDVLRFGTVSERFAKEPRGVMLDTLGDEHHESLYLPADAMDRCAHPAFRWIAYGCVPGTPGGAEPRVGDEVHDPRERFLYRTLPGTIVETMDRASPRVLVSYGRDRPAREYHARSLVRLHGWGRWAMLPADSP